ncbi:MAG TPA: bifunctional glutamate N-acetyltransferase/amino-acid acetyltransferase ArgJ [Bryobacteraceae bacterium]|nr:bifunctional glutamate N-acetyltransferase/amino-acid acetyltransferase ArgJ [Bryobacteraceae bacterium]HOL70553.1 bifunctional glutamate N-acetyltransferase/amino-acid acetyltransferase ArgJ [Bryobacteraceae bacterium]HOQ47763.1 bifunctional glutamate N-acetyltransferase/amino-acid acetyltransferase ArgJ [Bryobacteraceae bacterium]HPQ14219.1 bifunctional glutamate N-acetyltransferase/amino-acid acetyltransferase ArgJ [Bryobacteraceae bacterium]HPU74139.1 bifunctional glutamate N-acetyltrans
MKLPAGYRYASTYAGIRKEKKDDLALILSERPASAAGMFTRNRVKAAPVLLAQEHLRASRGIARAILVNAGNANCATRTGRRTALATCRAVAKLLKAPVAEVLPASTGVIGVDLDPQCIINALPRLFDRLSEDGFPDAARAILTTDTVPKMAFGEVPLRNGTVHIAGMTKGSGMIHPQLATTLGFVMTDAVLPPQALRTMLAAAVERSYHRLSVDGDTSTNDTIILMANGASGIKLNQKERLVFQEVLCWVMEDLAEKIARDGEGARKLVTIHVVGAQDDEKASRIARAIANSPLVKTAIAGSDPNWGRILSAAGNSGVEFDPTKVDIYLQRVLVCSKGVGVKFSERELKQKLDAQECLIRFVLNGSGKGEARFWSCDLTEKYIDINASYRT